MAGALTWLLTRILGCLVALLIGIVTIALVYVLTGSKSSLEDESGPMAVQVALVAAPFAFLAVGGVTAKTPWIAAAILTAMFWSLPVAHWWALRGAGGVPIGLALLLMISPVIITPSALAAGHIAIRLRGRAG